MSQRLIDEYEIAVEDYGRASPANKNIYLGRMQDARARLSRRMIFKSVAFVVLVAALIWQVST